MKTDLKLALACAALMPLTLAGCPSDDGSGDGDDAATSGATMTGGDDDGGPTGGGTVDGTGSGGGSGSEGDPDPTMGEVPPTFDCPAGEVVYDGHIVLGEFNVATETPIEDLDGVSVINGDLLIGGRNYVNLDFLQCITEVRGDLQIYGMPFLTDISGTDNITLLGRLPGQCPSCPGGMDAGKGTITISSNDALVNLDGFAGLYEIGEGEKNGGFALSAMSLVIKNNPVLETINGFDGLTIIWGGLTITNNPSLTQLDGLGGTACNAESPNDPLLAVIEQFNVSANESLCNDEVGCLFSGLQIEPSSINQGNGNNGC